MINDINIDLNSLTEADMYTIIKQTEEQNAKLRELAQGMWFAAQYLGANPDGATGSGFARQMREVGIEVNK